MIVPDVVVLLVAGILTGSGNAWTFAMPAGPVTVTAEFEPVSYTLRFLPNHPEASADETMEDQTHLFDELLCGTST